MTTSHPPHLPPIPRAPLTARVLGIPAEAVEKLAFQVYVENGSIDGRTLENWAEAERRLIADYLPRLAERRGTKRSPLAIADEPTDLAPKTTRKKKAASVKNSPAPKKRTTRGSKPKAD